MFLEPLDVEEILFAANDPVAIAVLVDPLDGLRHGVARLPNDVDRHREQDVPTSAGEQRERRDEGDETHKHLAAPAICGRE